MFRLAFLISLLLLLASSSRGQDEFGYFCNGFLHVEVPPNIPLDFQGVSFDSTLAGSDGAVTVINKGDKGIQYYVAILEFADEKGNYLISAPIYNVVRNDQTIPLDVPFKPWLLRNWPGGRMAPIPARSSSVETFGNVFVMLTCPASVHVAMVHVRYDDNTEFKYFSPRLRVSPTPSQPMEITDLETARRWSPIAVSGTIQIDARGHARIIELDASSGEFSRWLKKEFGKWKFTPQWTEGRPISVRLPFAFFLGDVTQSSALVDSVKRKGVQGPMLVWPSFL